MNGRRLTGCSVLLLWGVVLIWFLVFEGCRAQETVRVKEDSRVSVWTDPDTGCQYLLTEGRLASPSGSTNRITDLGGACRRSKELAAGGGE
jgi:hypothetical protein